MPCCSCSDRSNSQNSSGDRPIAPSEAVHVIIRTNLFEHYFEVKLFKWSYSTSPSAGTPPNTQLGLPEKHSQLAVHRSQRSQTAKSQSTRYLPSPLRYDRPRDLPRRRPLTQAPPGVQGRRREGRGAARWESGVLGAKQTGEAGGEH